MHEGPARLRLREWRDSMPIAVMVKDTYIIRKFSRVAIGQAVDSRTSTGGDEQTFRSISRSSPRSSSRNAGQAGAPVITCLRNG
jgi:hypothetical protein